jgi:hypothetical protein
LQKRFEGGKKSGISVRRAYTELTRFVTAGLGR